MKKWIYSAASVLFALHLQGCASITQSEMQPVSLTATHEGKTVEAECQLSNDKGSWNAKSPSNISVRKSGEDLEVTCKKEGMPNGILKAISRAAGSMFGNIIFGGGVGALIDHNKGNGYNYPDQLPVEMGKSVIVDKRIEEQKAQASQTPQTSQMAQASHIAQSTQ